MIKLLTCDATCFVPTTYRLSAPEALLVFYFCLVSCGVGLDGFIKSVFHQWKLNALLYQDIADGAS